MGKVFAVIYTEECFEGKSYKNLIPIELNLVNKAWLLKQNVKKSNYLRLNKLQIEKVLFLIIF